ncbi:sugar-binding transcriptional regulator [Diplocloster modestus]|uniref:Sugar-binding transcriptional regulator n=1 Tax=Diplocloster modestus TaxID=2850322 RepID=A0ABS6K350_9FIRM|nr:sugar-binding transcriptional regulator [Diplocloster modestus]MBU9724934.1 sugar-binding transcriptional regulator [Diplocloster modestus]
MDTNNSVQLYRVLKKYFLLRMNQKEIAQSENLSNATISRMINKAVDMGYVSYTLNLPVITQFDLEQEIKEKYHLDYVSVAHVDIDEPNIIARDVSLAVADYLNQIVRDGDIIGLSWGNTLARVAENLRPKNVSDVTIVGLNGGVSRNATSTGAENILAKFAKNYRAVGYSLPVPSFVDNSEIAKALNSDSKIREIFELIHKANILLFSVGKIREDSVLIQSGYFTEQDYKTLKEEGYVGDICSRYFRQDGTHLDNELYNRVIGISLEEVKQKDKRICVVMDEDKIKGLKGALAGGYINCLFLDEKSARKLVEEM